jgi:hypothetical protein
MPPPDLRGPRPWSRRDVVNPDGPDLFNRGELGARHPSITLRPFPRAESPSLRRREPARRAHRSRRSDGAARPTCYGHPTRLSPSCSTRGPGNCCPCPPICRDSPIKSCNRFAHIACTFVRTSCKWERRPAARVRTRRKESRVGGPRNQESPSNQCVVPRSSGHLGRRRRLAPGRRGRSSGSPRRAAPGARGPEPRPRGPKNLAP